MSDFSIRRVTQGGMALLLGVFALLAIASPVGAVPEDTGYTGETIQQGDSITNQLYAQDTDGREVICTIQVAKNPDVGTLSVFNINDNECGFSYFSAPDFAGQVTFTLRAAGAIVNFVDVPITITIEGNNPPVAVDNDYPTFDEDVYFHVTAPGVLGNDEDPDGDPLTANLITDASNGTLTLDPDGGFDYLPNENYNGPDSFVYEACDDGEPSLCDQATVTIYVRPYDDPPVAFDDSFQTPENTEFNGVLNGTDVEDEALTYAFSLNNLPEHGSVDGLDPFSGGYTYTPDPDYVGPDDFNFFVCEVDHPEKCDEGVITLTVTPVNEAPIADDGVNQTEANTPVNGQAVATDPDGDPLTFNVEIEQAAVTSGGIVEMTADGAYTYTPNEGFSGEDSFNFEVCDNGEPALCDQGTITITVAAIPGPTVPAETVTPEPTEPPNGTPIVTVTPEPVDPTATSVPAQPNPPSNPGGPVTGLPRTGAGMPQEANLILLVLAVAGANLFSASAIRRRTR